MNITNELFADSVIDLKQVIQDELDGKRPHRTLTEAEQQANRIAEIEDEIASLQYELDQLRAA